jgi:hypothetical protein
MQTTIFFFECADQFCYVHGDRSPRCTPNDWLLVDPLATTPMVDRSTTAHRSPSEQVAASRRTAASGLSNVLTSRMASSMSAETCHRMAPYRCFDLFLTIGRLQGPVN